MSRHSPVRPRDRRGPPNQGRLALQTTPAAEIVVGIDTHKHTHTAVALNALGARLGAMTAPVSRDGYRRIETWARAFGPVRAFGIEGTGSYGAGLSRALREAGHRVLEVNRPDRSARRRRGKDDPLDAEAAARAVLGGQATAEPKSGTGSVEMIRHLKIARDAAVKAKTQAMLTLKAIIVSAPAELREQLEGVRGRLALVRHLARCGPGRWSRRRRRRRRRSRPSPGAGSRSTRRSRGTTENSERWSPPPRPTSWRPVAWPPRQPPRCCCWSATTPSASGRRGHSPSCAAPVRSRRPAAGPAGTGSTAAATGRPTPPSTASSSPACASTSPPSTTSGAAREGKDEGGDHALPQALCRTGDLRPSPQAQPGGLESLLTDIGASSPG